ncbi:hypothetical protein EJB06_28380 [Massilia atriviolacea]|uniref:Uncharacterized protein n=1 Tax=Massilia atriviolacea TaxID=2495579 RepID=A0A430HDP0_9BURK|nr:hypothetical protein EJB06_28380 [Massilia atriviolacea]
MPPTSADAILAASPQTVIPAQAGIQSSSLSEGALDSRLRGNDGFKVYGDNCAMPERARGAASCRRFRARHNVPPTKS